MKRLGALVTGLALLLSGLPFTAVQAESQADFWAADWREIVWKDTEMPANASASVSLTTAKNDIEPFQLLLRPHADGTVDGVGFSDLTNGTHVLSADLLDFHYVDYVRSRTNSRYQDADDPTAVEGEDGIMWVNISNPSRTTSVEEMTAFPEILSNAPSKDLVADITQPIWIRVRVPADAYAGIYTGTVTVFSSFGEFSVPLSVEVLDVTIPHSSAPEAFSTELWGQLVGNFDTAVDVVVDAYGVEVDSPAWWDIMESFAVIMKENRLNVMMVNQLDLLRQAPGTKASADGTITFDWSFFNKFVSFFKEHGGIQLFAGGALAKYKANPKNYNNDVAGEMENDYTQGFIEILTQDPQNPDGTPVKGFVTFDHLQEENDPAGLNYLEQYAKALHDNLAQQGWSDIFYHHIIDEPGKDQLVVLYPILENVCAPRSRQRNKNMATW